MADALTGKTEVSAVVETVVANRIQMVLTAEMVVWPLMSDYSDLVGPGMDTLKIPRFSNFTVSAKSENTAVDAQTNTISADSLLLDKHEVVQVLIEDIASLQSKIGLVAAYVDQAAKDMAAKMDANLIVALDAGVSTSAPDHAVKFTDATNEDIEKLDILGARELLNIAKVPQSERWGIVDPTQEKYLLNISEFTRIDEAGSSAALRNGQVGKLFGFDIVLYQGVENTANAAYFGHKSAMAVARQLMPKVEQDRDLPNLSDRHSVSHIYGYKVLDSGKRFVQITETA